MVASFLRMDKLMLWNMCVSIEWEDFLQHFRTNARKNEKLDEVRIFPVECFFLFFIQNSFCKRFEKASVNSFARKTILTFNKQCHISPGKGGNLVSKSDTL